ncbi:hypothetical protein [Mesorhizobium sp. f-mel]
MADLDRQINEQIAVLQTRGADRGEIETRYQELCAWAIQECTDAGNQVRLPSPAIADGAEDATLKRLWSRIQGKVDAALALGQITEVSSVEIARCEDGVHVILYAETDDPDVIFYDGEDFHLHFDEEAWRQALSPVADSIGAVLVVFDCYEQRIFDIEGSPWRRVF